MAARLPRLRLLALPLYDAALSCQKEGMRKTRKELHSFNRGLPPSFWSRGVQHRNARQEEGKWILAL